ncbi:type VII secretion target [Nocardia suismassiliense]|uniref:Type VII secretion target n=1 Tax=Nocardia suismassiliense TaxID=2077092 RepID=A0ABW6R2F6_9NOCA
MKVDPTELRALATSMDTISGEIAALKARAKTDALSAALPGSTITTACTTAGDQIEAGWLRMAERCKAIADIAKGGAANYEVTDQDFRDSLKALGGGQ